MARIVSGTIAQPVRRHDPIRALLRAGRTDEAIVVLCALDITRPNDLVTKELCYPERPMRRSAMGSARARPA